MGLGLTSHMLEPETVLWLENELYKTKPATFVMGIEGQKWGLSLEPSVVGLRNLSVASDFLTKNLNQILLNNTPCLL